MSEEKTAQIAEVEHRSARQELPEATLLGRILDERYRVDCEVGRGGMGVVYQGFDMPLNRKVAIKTLHPQGATPELVTRFIREARTLAQIDHPRLVRVILVGQLDGIQYMVMQFLDGETLADRLKQVGALPADEVRQILAQVCEALSVLHGRGLIHRDIKPSNIMLSPEGTVTVMDLGIVKEAGEETGSTSLALGTPRYMAPEILESRSLDARADLYSLGVVGYHALAGEPPFDGLTPMAILYKQAHESPPKLQRRAGGWPARGRLQRT